MADQAEITRHSHPLNRIVICCTSVPQDARQILAKKAQEMGARHVLDLTSDVTHLVCEDITTPKYRYVAKMRTDVKVMMVGWVDSMYDAWIDGEDINPRDFEDKYQLPILYKLSVSVTGILDLADRKKIEELVGSHGASYHPDLTRHVTHLIAAAPTGKKYEFAMNNSINVVTVEWLHESLERGMALEESCYDPRLPKGELGVGAKPAPPAAVSVESLPEVSGKRKIRKRAGDLLGSQSQQMWGDILGQSSNPKPKRRDEWEENSHVDGAKKSPKDVLENNKGSEKLTVSPNTGLMAQCSFYIHGFNAKRAGVVRNILLSFGADIASSIQVLKDLQATYRLFVLVPVTMRKRDCPGLSGIENAALVTDWWLEACMHKEKLLEPSDGFTYSPFKEFPLEGFNGMEICLTGFTGVELLHMRKLIDLLGASFQEWLTKKRDLLVTSLPARGDKFEFAVQNDIPVVTDEWFKRCLKESKAVPFTDFLTLPNKRKPKEPDETESNQERIADGERTGNVYKRPRLDPQDMRKLGENLQSFSDRIRGKKPVEANAADFGGKTVDPIPAKSDTMDYLEKQHVPRGSEGILEKCTIYISKSLKARGVELGSVAKRLGAIIEDSIHPDEPITHMIHSSKTLRDTTKDFKVANAISGCHIVSPDWLYKCQESGKKVDEKAYPPIIAPTKGLEMDFAKGSSSSLSPVPTSELHTPMKTTFEVKQDEYAINDAENGQDLQGSSGSLNEIDRNITKEPTPSASISFPAPQTSVLNILKKPSSDNQEALDPASGKSSGGISDILGKLDKGEITDAIERRPPRGKLQGRATSNLSSYNNPPRESSIGGYAEAAASEAIKTQATLRPQNDIGHSPVSEILAPSQSIRYEDPEAEKERNNVRAKLSGDIAGLHSPKNQRLAIKRVKTAVDLEGGLRRGRRAK